MKIEKIIKESLEEMLEKLRIEYKKIEIEEKEDNTFSVNIESDDATTLIGHHGETIYSLQHVSRTKKEKDFNIVLDVDNYRQRQEESVLAIAERKVEFVRKTNRAQSLPPMTGYFRRVIHLRLMEPEFDDIETLSQGDGDARHIIIKPTD